VTDEQIRNLESFAAEFRRKLPVAERDFNKKRAIIEALDVRVTLAVENEEKVVYVQSSAGGRHLSFESIST
jgi:hypothetical protein